MIFATRRVIRTFGWLLTPLAAWAASFLGGWAGAAFGSRVASPRLAMGLLVGGAVLGAFLGAAGWVFALRRAWHHALRTKRERLMRDRAVRRDQQAGADTRTEGGSPAAAP